MTIQRAALISFGALALGSYPVRAQCQPEWSSLNGGADWFAEFRTLTPFDEGFGQSLFCGGGFHNFAGVPIHTLARWDGWKATPIEPEITYTDDTEGVFTLLAVDKPLGGLPGGLYVGGAFHDIGGLAVHSLARWDGLAWHEFGGASSDLAVYVRALCLFDEDEDGPKPPTLFVGGKFDLAGELPARSLARWDGQSWMPLNGLGFENPNQRPSVYSLAVYDDGRGPALYVGGSFYYVDGKYAQNIARWDGQVWEQVGVDPYYGLTATVNALAVYDDDGDGPQPPALFAGGQFSYADGKPINRIARWDGQEWTDVGGWNSSGGVTSLAVARSPDDERENLYMGGYFNILPDGTPIKSIARWDGEAWREVDFGVHGFGGGNRAGAIMPFDEDGDGPNPGGLYVGGAFHYAGAKGVQTYHIARWGCPLPPKCDADLDQSGALDLFDFLIFVNYFNTSDPAADCDASNSLDLFDFLCFTNAFNAGC